MTHLKRRNFAPRAFKKFHRKKRREFELLVWNAFLVKRGHHRHLIENACCVAAKNVPLRLGVDRFAPASTNVSRAFFAMPQSEPSLLPVALCNFSPDHCFGRISSIHFSAKRVPRIMALGTRRRQHCRTIAIWESGSLFRDETSLTGRD